MLRPLQKVSTQCKEKFQPITGHKGPEGEYCYSSTLSLTSAPDGSDQSHAPASLNPGKRPGKLFTDGWVGPRAGVDKYGKSHSPHRVPIPGPFIPWRVAIPTDLSRPATINMHVKKCYENFI